MLPMNPKDTDQIRRDEAKRLATETIGRLIDEHPPEFIDFLMEQLLQLEDSEPDGLSPLPYDRVSTAGSKGVSGSPEPRPDQHMSNVDRILKRG